MKIGLSITIVISLIIVTAVFGFIFWMNPSSPFLDTVYRFQTLIAGIFAGLAALIAAIVAFWAAKIPIDENRRRDATVHEAMRAAGAANLLGTCESITLALINEASKPEKERSTTLLLPSMAPSLEVIGTQDSAVLSKFANFLNLASEFDAHTTLGTWPYDSNRSHPEELKLLKEVQDAWKELKTSLNSAIARQK